LQTFFRSLLFLFFCWNTANVSSAIDLDRFVNLTRYGFVSAVSMGILPPKVTKRPLKKAHLSKSSLPVPTTTARKALNGTVFYLASGHGGPDPGAIGRFGRHLLPEDEYAYDVTIRLAQLLKQQGATVYMMVKDPNDGIRNDAVLKLDHDEVAYPNQRIPLNQTARLNQTTTAVNRLYARHKSGYQRLITIHVDSRSQEQTIDVFFYHHDRSPVGKRLAKHIHRRFKTNYKRHQPSRPYSGKVSTRNTLYVVKNSRPPTVFIELGNIQNRQDQRRFLIAANRQALASWMAQGVLDDYRLR